MEDQSGSSQISIAGGPVRGNNYLIDGVPITDAANRAIIIPSLEAVAEVKIQANTYDAEMARTGGGMFNTLMKSGTNIVPWQPVRPPAPHRLGCQQLLQQRRRRSHHRPAQRHLGRQLRRRGEDSEALRRQEPDVLLSGLRALRRHAVFLLGIRHAHGAGEDGRLLEEPQSGRQPAPHLRSDERRQRRAPAFPRQHHSHFPFESCRTGDCEQLPGAAHQPGVLWRQ